MLPIDEYTKEPHSCEQGLAAWREQHPPKTYQCKYCNEVQITFSTEHMSESGRFVPIEVESGLPHKCPKRQYNPNTKVATTIFR